jgi:RNA polymerase sigma-70 factor, ECF subfamily
MQLADQELIQLIQRHDSEAFAQFFARYQPAVQRHLGQMLRDAVMAEDLVQEVFLRVWMRAEQWDGRGEVKGWLYRIATNLALNQLRARRRRPQQPLEAPARAVQKDDWPSNDDSFVPTWLIDAAALEPPALLAATERQHLMQRLVNELPGDKQEVFRLVYDGEMDLHSVADQLGIPAGTVKSRLHYSKKQIARRWRELED